MHQPYSKEQLRRKSHFFNLSCSGRATCWRQKPCDWFPWCPPLFCQFQRDEGSAIVECRSGFNLVHLVGQCVLVEAEHLEGFGKLHRQVDVQPVQPGASQSLHSMLKSSPINRLEGVGKGFAGHLPPALLYGAGHCGSESRRQGDAGDGLVLRGPAGRVVDPIEEAGHVHTVKRLPCRAFRPRKWESQLKNFTRSVVPAEKPCDGVKISLMFFNKSLALTGNLCQ